MPQQRWPWCLAKCEESGKHFLYMFTGSRFQMLSLHKDLWIPWTRRTSHINSSVIISIKYIRTVNNLNLCDCVCRDWLNIFLPAVPLWIRARTSQRPDVQLTSSDILTTQICRGARRNLHLPRATLNSSPASGERHPQKLCATLTLKRVWKVRCTTNEFWPRLRTGLVRPQVCKASASSIGWLDGFLPAIGRFPTSEDGNEGTRAHACSSIVGCHQHSAYQQSVQELQDCVHWPTSNVNTSDRDLLCLCLSILSRDCMGMHTPAGYKWLYHLTLEINTIKRRRKASG
jgi:hypothetical protein